MAKDAFLRPRPQLNIQDAGQSSKPQTNIEDLGQTSSSSSAPAYERIDNNSDDVCESGFWRVQGSPYYRMDHAPQDEQVAKAGPTPARPHP